MLLKSASMLPVLWMRLELLLPMPTCKLARRLALRLPRSSLLPPAMVNRLLLLPGRRPERGSWRGLAWITETRRLGLLGLPLADRCLKEATLERVDRWLLSPAAPPLMLLDDRSLRVERSAPPPMEREERMDCASLRMLRVEESAWLITDMEARRWRLLPPLVRVERLLLESPSGRGGAPSLDLLRLTPRWTRPLRLDGERLRRSLPERMIS